MNEQLLLRDSVIHVVDGAFTAWPNHETYWSRRDRPELSVGHILSVYRYTETWNRQERHPTGDELAVLLDGDIDVLLDTGDGERATHLAAGAACIIPMGAWHRAAVHAPSTILFVTPAPTYTEERALT